MSDKELVKFRAGVSRGIKDKIDRKNNVIHGYSVISTGEAMGHGVMIDETTLEQVNDLGNAAKKGLKSRFGHPNMSHSAFGTFLGRSKDFRIDGDRVRADLHVDETAFNSPKGNLGKYVLDLAESDPDAFGASVVIEMEEVYILNEDGTRKTDKEGNELLPLARVKTLYASDIVDEPATGDSLFEFFSDSVKPSAEVTQFLTDFLKQPGASEKVTSFLNKYVENEEYKLSITHKISNLIKPENGLIFKPLNEELSMPDEVKLTDNPVKGTNEAHDKEIAELAVQKETDRVTAILSSCEKLKLETEFAKKLITDKVPFEKATQMIIDKSAENLKSVPPSIIIGRGAYEKSLEVIQNAMLMKGGVLDAAKPADAKIIDGVNQSEYRGFTIQKLAAHCLEAEGYAGARNYDGIKLFEAVMEAFRRRSFASAISQGTGDFVNVLSNVANKAMARGWEFEDTTFQLWCRSDQLQNYKIHEIDKMTEFSDVQRIHEGEAPKHGRMSDSREQVKLEKWGVKYILSEEAMINDDLGAFTRIPERQMRSLKRRMNQLCYSMLYNGQALPTTNRFAGPVLLEDGNRIFTAGHGNFAAVAAGGVPTQTTVDVGFNAMRRQVGLTPDAGISNPIRLNIRPRYIISAVEYQLELYKLLNNIGYNVAGEDSAAAGTIAANIHGPGQPRNLTPIFDGELDFVDSANTPRYRPWYLAADGNLYDTMVLYTLNGQTSPITNSAPLPVGDAYGMVWTIKHPFVFKILDFRGLYCNSGAVV